MVAILLSCATDPDYRTAGLLGNPGRRSPPCRPELGIKDTLSGYNKGRAAKLTKPRPYRLPHYALPILPPAAKPPNVSFDNWSTPLLIPLRSRPPFFGKRTHRVRLGEHRRLVFFHILNSDLFDSGHIEQNEAYMCYQHRECEETKQSGSKGYGTGVSFRLSSLVLFCFTYRAMMTTFRMSRSSLFLWSATNPSRVAKVQAQNRQAQNTNCRKN